MLLALGGSKLEFGDNQDCADGCDANFVSFHVSSFPKSFQKVFGAHISWQFHKEVKIGLSGKFIVIPLTMPSLRLSGTGTSFFSLMRASR